MEKQFTYTFQPLLTQKGGKISGPMSPLLFAQEMGKQVGFRSNRLARVWFGEETVNQRREDGGLTGHDTLLIGMVYSNDVWLSLWVDDGVSGRPVAMCYQSDGEVLVTRIYKRSDFVRRLTDTETREIFQSVFKDLSQVAIRRT